MLSDMLLDDWNCYHGPAINSVRPHITQIILGAWNVPVNETQLCKGSL
jgi:hypothetical protein